jgi:prevent-host-death family protein
MRRVTTYYAKNRLSELLDAVTAGETIEILRRGKSAARLVPVPSAEQQFATPADAATWLRANRTKIARETIRDLIEEGRR